MEWVMMAFTFALGAFIGKLSVRFEAVINVVATAIIGAYVQMQVWACVYYIYVCFTSHYPFEMFGSFCALLWTY